MLLLSAAFDMNSSYNTISILKKLTLSSISLEATGYRIILLTHIEHLLLSSKYPKAFFPSYLQFRILLNCYSSTTL